MWHRLPLLFQGDDFSRTDIDAVPPLPATTRPKTGMN
jgi:hypothetical protein